MAKKKLKKNIATTISYTTLDWMAELQQEWKELTGSEFNQSQLMEEGLISRLTLLKHQIDHQKKDAPAFRDHIAMSNERTELTRQGKPTAGIERYKRHVEEFPTCSQCQIEKQVLSNLP